MSASRGLRFIHIHHDELSSKTTWGRHRHPFCEISYVVRGEFWRSDDRNKWKCEPGSFLFHAAGKPHMSWIEPEGKIEAFYLAFSCERLPRGLPVLCKDHRGRVLEILRWLDRDVDLNFPGIRDYRSGLLKALLNEFQFLSTYRERPMVRKVRAYVRLHMKEPLLLDKLASVAGMSKYYFAHKYRALNGISPMEDARQIKAHEARRLLLQTNLPLKVVAERVGLGSVQALCYMLRHQLGMSSRELRGKMFSKAPQIKS